MSTLFVNNLNTASGTDITIPTGKKLVGTDGGGISAPGMVVQFVHKNVGILQLSASATLVSLSTIDITPKFANSKIFIQVLNHMYIKSLAADNWRGCLIHIKRGDTSLDDDSGKYGEAANFTNDGDRYMTYSTRMVVDEPNTTSTVTYSIFASSFNGNVSIDINHGSYGSGGKIQIFEVAQ